MDNQTLIIVAVFVLFGIFGMLGAFHRKRVDSLKDRVIEAETKARKQSEINEKHNQAVSDGKQIQQESDKAKEACDKEVKEAQASEKPIQKSIDLGNDLVDRFNSSSR